MAKTKAIDADPFGLSQISAAINCLVDVLKASTQNQPKNPHNKSQFSRYIKS